MANKLGVSKKLTQCNRVGPKHQAGSDSLLTVKTYLQLKRHLGSNAFEKHVNCIFGIPKPETPKPLQTPTSATRPCYSH